MRLRSNVLRRATTFSTAAVGCMNIVSALYPAIPGRLDILQDLIPLHFIRGAQTATVLAGFFLILLADGLRKRRRRALQIAVALLVLAAVLNLIKGLDFEEATITALLAAALVFNRGAFDVPSRVPVPRRVLSHVAAYFLLYYCYVLTGFLVLRRAIRPVPTLLGATREPLLLFSGSPFYRYTTPQAAWFGRSVVCLGGVAALIAVVQLLRPLIPRRATTADEIEAVRDLVRKYGSDTLSYFSLQHGRSYFFDQSGEAFLSYRLWRNVAVVGGDPVGAPDRIGVLVSSFLEFAEANGIEPCFLGISSDRLHLYQSHGLRTVKIGEEAVLDLTSFDPFRLRRKVRRAVRHICDRQVSVQTFAVSQVPADIRDQIERISKEWVGAKGGSERGFSMTLGRVPDSIDKECEIAVALEGRHVWGYLVLVPVYQANAWSLDAMRRRLTSPNGLTEFLVVLLNSQQKLFPDQLDWDGPMTTVPRAQPGITKFI